MTVPEKALFTIKETGELLSLSASSVYRLIEEGMLTKVYPRPRCVRVTRESICAHLERSNGITPDALRHAQEMGRARRKHALAEQQAAKVEEKKGGFLSRFGLLGK